MALLAPLTPDEQATFLVVSLPEPVLRKLAGQLGTAPPGVRLDRMSVWELADSLVDYYANDAEVAGAVDKVLRRTLGESPLLAAVSADGGGAAVTALVLESRDPAGDLAWALLLAAGDGSGPLASSLVQTIIAEYDAADAAAKEDAEQPAEPEPPDVEGEIERRTAALSKEAERARGEHARVLKRADTMKERVADLEHRLRDARRKVRDGEKLRTQLQAERDRLAEERETLRAQVRSGTAAEVARLGDELEAARRRERALEEDRDEARDAAATVTARLRALEQAPGARPVAADSTPDDVPSSDAAWHLPIFTAEFYDSLRRWDRRIVRSAFEKAHRLAEDWRHPSLRAIPLEGLPGYYRLRVATDVRLIYRLGDGGRVELLSLIDREDLPRYIRNVKNA